MGREKEKVNKVGKRKKRSEHRRIKENQKKTNKNDIERGEEEREINKKQGTGEKITK